MRKEREPSPKQRLFVGAIIAGNSHAEAVRLAGYKVQPSAAKRKAWALLQLPHVAAYLEAEQAKLREAAQVEGTRVVEELAHIAFADITEAVSWDNYGLLKLKASEELPENVRRAIASVKEGRHGLEIKFHSKGSALDKLARHLGLYNDRVVHDLSAELRAVLESLPHDQREEVLQHLTGELSQGDVAGGDRPVQ